MPEEQVLDRSTLDTYLASLKESAAADDAGMLSGDEVKALFAADGEAVDVDAESEPADDAEVAAIIAAGEPQSPDEEDFDIKEVRIFWQ